MSKNDNNFLKNNVDFFFWYKLQRNMREGMEVSIRLCWRLEKRNHFELR